VTSNRTGQAHTTPASGPTELRPARLQEESFQTDGDPRRRAHRGRLALINVVPSQDEFEAFAPEKLLPAAQRVDDRPPEISFFPIQGVIQG
jgi:hypothetical protein